MEKYNCIELFADARARAYESRIEFPKYVGFKYHLPNKENQRWHLNISDDWVRLTNFWKDVRSKCIPRYLYDLKKPSDNQKHVESLDKISASVAQPLPQIVAVESKQNVRMADSLIVSHVIPLLKPVPHRPVIGSLSNSPAKPTPSSQPRPCECPPQSKSTSQQKSCKSPAKLISTSSPKPTAKASLPVQLKQKNKSSYYLPISPSPSPYAKTDYTPL
ncbi:hypothetical protein Cgig2_023257 [Carnegiea gigantea]|uniref:Uncharacterized protein n=1 Tax=Carnegiea gigantea TaxID=171969 RepID=A0A9Q1GYV3_9CARY|nr:hypothetical protein Cgig2_023257 [Carnegiea gigantea]